MNGAPVERLADAVGRFPVVVISPDDHRLTDGAPEERRRLVDTILCQESSAYLDHLVRYRRALRQRNELLGRSRGAPSNVPLLEAWDEELVRHGARITLRRLEFFARFDTFVGEAWRLIERQAEQPTIRYRAFAPSLEADEPAISQAMRDLLRERSAVDRERGMTHTGPHRDELIFKLDDLARANRVDAVSLRLCWVYGPRRRTECLVNRLIVDARTGQATRIPFGGGFHRQFVYVDDVVDAIRLALDARSLPQRVYNVTGGERFTFDEIATVIGDVVAPTRPDFAPGPDPDDYLQERFTIDRIATDLSWRPRHDLRAGVAAYAAWLRSHEF